MHEPMLVVYKPIWICKANIKTVCPNAPLLVSHFRFVYFFFAQKISMSNTRKFRSKHLLFLFGLNNLRWRWLIKSMTEFNFTFIAIIMDWLHSQILSMCSTSLIRKVKFLLGGEERLDLPVLTPKCT